MDQRQHDQRNGLPGGGGGDRRHGQQNSWGSQRPKRSRSPGDDRGGGRQYGGGRNDRHGGRDYGGGGRGGRGGRGPRPQRPRDGQVMVQVNYFRLKPISSVGQGEWIQYQVEIRDAMRRKKKNPDGTDVNPVEFEIVPKLVKRKDENGDVVQAEKTVNLDRGGTSLSRRILITLQKKLSDEKPPRTFATDGEKQVFSPEPLFTKEKNLLPEETKLVDASKGTRSTGGIYGPADTGEPHNRPQAPQTGPFEDYYVRVTKDCEEDDEDGDKAKMAWFVVRLREVGRIGYHVVKQSLMPLIDEAGQRESMRQCMEIILKNQMILALKSWGRSPRMFFFPEDVQVRIRGNAIMPNYTETPNVEPFVGITQAVRFCADGNTYVTRDVGTRWFNLDKRKNRPIPLLDSHDMTFAGVKIERGFDKMIEDPGLRRRIQEALEKILFHAKYTAKFDEGRKKKIATSCKRQNMSDDMIARRIENRQRKVHLNQRLKTTDNKKEAIVWAADDQNLYEFERKDYGDLDENGAPRITMHTIYSYFLTHHGVTLRYPKMPIFWTEVGYLPAEFLLQAKSPAKGANSLEQCKRVLGFHDEFAGGDKIIHLKDSVAEMKGLMQRKMENLQLESGQKVEVLDTGQFNFEVDNAPLKVRATLLPEPNLAFRDKQRVNIDNGSWNLRDAKFSRPADLPSFAVLDLCDDFVNILNQLLLRARSHGIVTPPEKNFSEMIEKLRIGVDDPYPDNVSDGFFKAIKRAKDFFLSDSYNFFRERNVMFKSICVTPDGVTTECLVYPLIGGEPSDKFGGKGQSFGLIYPPEKVYETHMMKYEDKEYKARQVVIVKDDLGHQGDVDPFDFRWSSELRCNEAKIRGQWTRATFIGYGWKLLSGRVERDANRISNLLSCQASQVECPAVIFINLPSTDPGTYHFVKLLSNFGCGGIPSQCIVSKTYRNQKRPEQYFSNIALKLNTKLANKLNGACAWEISGQGLSWISEVPTLIMGLSMSRGAGKDSQTAVAASALLGVKPGMHMHMAQVLRIQSQSDIVEDNIMRAITKTLTIQFYKHTGELPSRVLVFRDGSSEGNFQELVERELVNVREGINEVKESLFNDGVDCAKWPAPRITFTVCWNDHNVRVVPEELSHGRNKNVWSGTCIDREIMPLKWSVALSPDKIESYESQDQANKDFLLTAHGGLKGTSKPVFYRVIVDENRMGDNHRLEETPLMQSIVYGMSFQYGTATKAVRKVPVVLYSKRLAETAIGFLAYIIGNKGAKGVDPLVKVDVNSAGRPTEDKSWVRREMNGDTYCDYAIKNELLPGFSPYETRLGDKSIWRTPFRTHLSS